MEGVKGNASRLIDLLKGDSIVCLQETWLWSFESNVIDCLVPNYVSFVRCSDMNDNISNFQVPRGKGGIAIMWPKSFGKYMKRLEDGNERVQAVKMQVGEARLCIINAYLPTLNLPSSRENYQEMLDVVHHIIDRYSPSHKIILCGDLNGSLLQSRSNPHDGMLKEFVQEHGFHLDSGFGVTPTFFGHSGASSQIDYVLADDPDLILSVNISQQSPINMSSHVSIKASLSIYQDQLRTEKRKNVSYQKVTKFQWDKIDEDQYQYILEDMLQTSNMDTDSVNVLIQILNSASKQAVPNKLLKVKGPKFKLAPSVRQLEAKSKQIFSQWKNAGSPGPENPLSLQRKVAKYAVRKQIRREFASAREAFYSELMENPSSKHFYRLIRRNQSDVGKSSVSLKVDDEDVTDPAHQCRAFGAYFEDLAAQKSHPDFDQDYLDLTLRQVDLMEELANTNPDSLPVIFESEVLKAIKSLNSGKSADEMGLTAEHLKYSGTVLLAAIATIFNEIFRTKIIPDSFKSGIITPVHKKGKDPCKMDNYRGITVSSILGKLFETVLLNRLDELNNDQSELQFGFTKGLSLTMAALILCEAVLDSALTREPLYIAALDTQKAFDVVSHPVLMKMLYLQGINRHLWQVIRSMYSGLSAKVKWEGAVSQSFCVLQGVRQGGILSTHFYKTYLNHFLLDLESRALGKYIGDLYMGCPIVADDLLFLSSSDTELQLMFTLAFINSQEKRYIIHPQKSTAQR